MHRYLCLIASLLTFTTVGCSAEYYARRAALREQRLAERAQRRAARDHQRMMQTCGHPQSAFERGHNEGMARRPMDTSWIAQCPYQLQQQQGQAYMAGYQQGASYAPAPVVVAPRQPIVIGNAMAGGGYESCRFSSDCGGADMACRPWGNMGNVCMGYGHHGDPCWFGSDCLSGWCDGHGARTCR